MKKMEKLLRVLPLSYCVLLICFFFNVLHSSALANSSVCSGVLNCVKCDGGNTTSRCSKCSQLVVLRGKQCGNGDCPPGYTRHWATLVEYMASACNGNRESGWSDEVVGACVGVCVCIAGGLGAVLYLRRGCRRRSAHHPARLHHSAASSSTDDGDLLEFTKQVAALRPHAHTFLDMINDTRRQVRHLQSPTALQPYKPVLKDLSRILILVNRSDSKLGPPPPDWETLLAWAQRILARYKKNHQPSQVNDLVNFLSGGETGMTQFAVSVFDSNYNTRKGEDSDWQPWGQELDDFFTLGFRPQDEITTEL